MCDSRLARESPSKVRRPIDARLSPVSDQSSSLRDKRQTIATRSESRMARRSVHDEIRGKATTPRVRRHVLKIAKSPTLFRQTARFRQRQRDILRSSHDPDYNGGFARLLEQLGKLGKLGEPLAAMGCARSRSRGNAPLARLLTAHASRHATMAAQGRAHDTDTP